MTATNHTVTGMVIATAVKTPWAAVPLAFASHFLLDAIPHFGNHPVINKRVQAFTVFLAADMAVAMSLLLSVLLLSPPGVWLIVACGIIAASPDLMWIPEYLAMISKRPVPKSGVIKKFHSSLQKELPGAFALEAVWFVVMSGLLLWLMRPV